MLYNYLLEISSAWGEFPNRYVTICTTSYERAGEIANTIVGAMEYGATIERLVALENEDHE